MRRFMPPGRIGSGPPLAEMLSENIFLKTLILKGNCFGDKDADLFGEALKANSTLQTLDLSHNRIGDLGGIALGQCLQVNEAIISFNIAWNRLRNRGTTALLLGARVRPVTCIRIHLLIKGRINRTTPRSKA